MTYDQAAQWLERQGEVAFTKDGKQAHALGVHALRQLDALAEVADSHVACPDEECGISNGGGHVVLCENCGATILAALGNARRPPLAGGAAT